MSPHGSSAGQPEVGSGRWAGRAQYVCAIPYLTGYYYSCDLDLQGLVLLNCSVKEQVTLTRRHVNDISKRIQGQCVKKKRKKRRPGGWRPLVTSVSGLLLTLCLLQDFIAVFVSFHELRVKLYRTRGLGNVAIGTCRYCCEK